MDPYEPPKDNYKHPENRYDPLKTPMNPKGFLWVSNQHL